jgi:hypothetical protein
MELRFPPELEEMIFKIAARRNRGLIPTFLYVARRIHIWSCTALLIESVPDENVL